MKKALILISLMFLVCTCKKNNAFGKIEIEAVDYYTGEGIEGVQYLLYKTPPGDLLKTKTIRKEKTDATGKLVYRYFRVHLIRKYQLRTDYFEDLGENNPNYLIVNEIDGVKDLDGEKDLLLLNDMARIKIKSYFVRRGRVSYHIKNENCFDNTDTLWLEEIFFPTLENKVLYGYNLGLLNSGGGVFNGGTGCLDDFKQIDDNDPFHSKKPAGEYRYNIKVKRNGITTESVVYKIILAGQDNLVEILY